MFMNLTYRQIFHYWGDRNRVWWLSFLWIKWNSWRGIQNRKMWELYILVYVIGAFLNTKGRIGIYVCYSWGNYSRLDINKVLIYIQLWNGHIVHWWNNCILLDFHLLNNFKLTWASCTSISHRRHPSTSRVFSLLPVCTPQLIYIWKWWSQNEQLWSICSRVCMVAW